MPRSFAALTAMAILLAPPGASALDDFVLQSGSRLCTAFMPQAEREFGIPAGILQAISTIEAGQHDGVSGNMLPWPWTINAYGRGYYLHTRQQAVEKARAFQKRHAHNMAVGCMQINVSANKKAFASLSDAFDPAQNVAFAARMLRDAYDDEGSWKKAVAAYHTGDSDTGVAFARKVYKLKAKMEAEKGAEPDPVAIPKNPRKSYPRSEDADPND